LFGRLTCQALARISDEVYIQYNCKLTTIGTALASLADGYVRSLCFNDNGAGCPNQNLRAAAVRFCDSARDALCTAARTIDANCATGRHYNSAECCGG